MGMSGIGLFWSCFWLCVAISASQDNIRNGTIRLAGGGYARPYRGRVEMYANGEWGTICDDSWDVTDARVVCRELGFNTTIVSPFRSARFGLGSGPIFLDDVMCQGNETRLWDCPADPLLEHNCDHAEDASVSCGLDCEDGSYVSGSTCVRCSNCENQKCHYSDGACTLGCVSGFYGDRCDANCSSITPSCLVCDRDDGQCTSCSDRLKPPQCTVCADTYYNSSAACVLCSINCVNRLCDPANGRCTLDCPAGLYGDTCQSVCSAKTANCIHCEQDSGLCTRCSDILKSPDCTDCQDDYYKSGTTCVQCSNCVNRQCDSDTGRCTLGCPVGYYGEKCDSQCSTKTPRCTQCDRDGGQCTACSGQFKPPQCTACDDGYYKSGTTCVECSSNCVNRQCDPASGKCTSGCPTGRYGDTCDSLCSASTARCTECVQDGGTCTACSGNFKSPQCTDCQDGYFLSGNTCVQCSNCVNQQCDSQSGSCTLGCPTGYYGDTCESLCSASTTRCTECVQDSGHCTACSDNFNPPECTDCQDGYYKSGTTCVQYSMCGNRQCDRETGSCTLGCLPGFYGDMCESLCSANTARCTQCVQDSGKCTACNANFNSPQCTGCPVGYHGDRCDAPCSAQSSRCTQCDQDSGQCTVCSGLFMPPQCTACQDGYYKYILRCVPCSSNCWNRQCDPASGRCTFGCPAGFYGDRCYSSCAIQTPGCSQCAQDGGLCTVCSGDVKPPQCTETLDAEMERRIAPLIGAIVGSIVGVGLLIGIVVTAVICRRMTAKRRTRKASVSDVASAVLSPWGNGIYLAGGTRQPWLN